MEKIGFIGLGRMGLPMAANIMKGGYDVLCYDVVASQLDAAAQKGGQILHLCCRGSRKRRYPYHHVT